MSQSDGFISPGDERKVCHLQRSFYGLKQSPMQWNKQFHDIIKKLNFGRSLYDSCVYDRKLNDKTVVFLLLYVDDILIANTSKVEIQLIKEALGTEFEMKDLRMAKMILGMDIKRDRTKKVSISCYLFTKGSAKILHASVQTCGYTTKD